MATCKKCGQPLVENSVFCHICGAAVDDDKQPDSPKRTQVYAGVIKKCPACGAELPSMAAICPSCGHEVVSSEMAIFLKKFVESLDKCDQEIIEEDKERQLYKLQYPSGWKKWNITGKIAWILLNIVTFCFPLLIAFAIKRFRDTRFSPSEKQKASLIDNFEVPNEKGAILDALSLIQGKISSTTAGRINNKNWHWIKIWYAKASQINEKAKILLPGEKAVNDVFQHICETIKSSQKKYSLRCAGAALLSVIYCFFVVGAIWFMLSRGLIPFAEITSSGVLISPYLWKVYLPFLFSLCILIFPKIPSKAKIFVALIPWLAVLAVSCNQKVEIRKEAKRIEEENVADFASAVEEVGNQEGMELSSYKFEKDTLQITFQTPSFDKEPIIAVKDAIKQRNRDYHYKISIRFITESGIVVYSVSIDEYSAVTVVQDNTNGFVEQLSSLCSEYGLNISSCSPNSKGYEITLCITPTSSQDFNVFSDEIVALFHNYDYSTLDLTIEGPPYQDGFQLTINESGEIKKVDAYSLIFSLSPILEAHNWSVDWHGFVGDEVHLKIKIQKYDLKEITTVQDEIKDICLEFDQEIWMDIEDSENLVWRIHFDEFGDMAFIDAYEITELVKDVCDKWDIYIEHVDSYGDGIDFRIECGTSSKRTINAIEEDLVAVYKKTGLKTMAIYFENDKESSLAIRWTVIENDGAVHYATDHTR